MLANGAVSVVTDQGITSLVAPYNPSLGARARELGGRWNAAAKAWRFDPRDEPQVRALARELFGVDGSEDLDDLVTVRVPASPDRRGSATITVAGRIVAERRRRDDPVRLASGVVISSGHFHATGGSMRYPEIGDNDVVLDVRDIPRAAAVHAGLDIVEATDHRLAALRAERDQLAARLVQIDQEISDAQG
jgi:hypothetical protein